VADPRGNEQSWPLSPSVVLRSLTVERLIEIAAHFDVAVPPYPSWDQVCWQLESEPAVHSVALLHVLTRRELGEVCRQVNVHDSGPTQDVLARLFPLCKPSE
jgi:hypothetical protein